MEEGGGGGGGVSLNCVISKTCYNGLCYKEEIVCYYIELNF